MRVAGKQCRVTERSVEEEIRGSWIRQGRAIAVKRQVADGGRKTDSGQQRGRDIFRKKYYKKLKKMAISF